MNFICEVNNNEENWSYWYCCEIYR
jgi:hypothetical protein